MTTNALKAQVHATIQAHCLWKAQLSTALTLGTTPFRAADVSRDDRCRCGQWLQGMRSERTSQRWERAREIHARFHAEAGNVLALVLAGKRSEARALASPGGPYLEASQLFIEELQSWVDEGQMTQVRSDPGAAATCRPATSATVPR